VKGQTNLSRRSGVYGFRIAVPRDLRCAFDGQREIRRSLRTTDKAEALRRAAAERVRRWSEFTRIRRTLNPERRGELSAEEIKRLIAAWSASVLADDDAHVRRQGTYGGNRA